MITLRRAQVQALAIGVFEAWVASHLAEFFAWEIAGIAPAELRSRIRAASEQARRYGFCSDADVCRYIDLTFVLGASFGCDPDLPWAAEILTDDRLVDPEMKMDLLYEWAGRHVGDVDPRKATSETGSTR